MNQEMVFWTNSFDDFTSIQVNCTVLNNPQLLNVKYETILTVNCGANKSTPSQQDWNFLQHLSHVYFPRAQSHSTPTSSILAMYGTGGLDSVLVLDLLTYLAAEVCVCFIPQLSSPNISLVHTMKHLK